jgi:hypothetical protein
MGRNENIIPLFGSLSEENGIEHSLLPIPSKPQFSFPPKLGGIGRNEILFNEIFTKTPKMPLIFFLNTRLSLILYLHLLSSSCATIIISNLEVFSLLFFFGYHQHNSKINKIYRQRLYIYIYIYIYIYFFFFFSS